MCTAAAFLRLAGLWSLVLALGAQSPDPELRLHSRHLGTRVAPDGTLDVVRFGPEGREERALAIGDGWSPLFGPGESYVLFERGPRGPERRLRILGPDSRERAQFAIPAARAFLLGRESLALMPRAEHGAGTAFELEFLDLRGSSLTSTALDELSLIAVAPLASAHWVASSVDSLGESHVHVFDPRGRELWERRVPGFASPVVALSPSGELAVVGALQEDLRHSSLSLIDAAGKTLATEIVPAFRLAAFDPAERRVVLAGGDTLTLVRCPDGAVLWSRTVEHALALGESVVFSSDGAELAALTVESGDEVTPLATLVHLRAEDGASVRSRRVLAELRLGPHPWVLELAPTGGERWLLATRTGVWRL